MIVSVAMIASPLGLHRVAGMGENVTAAILLRLALEGAEENEMNVSPENHYEVGESTINADRVGLNVEYRVRPITRYIVTRYSYEVNGDGSETGSAGPQSSVSGAEYANYDTAYQVAYALCKAEHDRLGYEPFDTRVQYPHNLNGLQSSQDPA